MRLYNVVFRYRGEVHLALIEARNGGDVVDMFNESKTAEIISCNIPTKDDYERAERMLRIPYKGGEMSDDFSGIGK